MWRRNGRGRDSNEACSINPERDEGNQNQSGSVRERSRRRFQAGLEAAWKCASWSWRVEKMGNEKAKPMLGPSAWVLPFLSESMLAEVHPRGRYLALT